jgi:hypothetical protein
MSEKKTLATVQAGDLVLLHKVNGETLRLRVVAVTKATIKTEWTVWSKTTGRKRGSDARWEPEWIEAIDRPLKEDA